MGGSSPISQTSTQQNTPNPLVTARQNQIVSSALNYAEPNGQPLAYPTFDYAKDIGQGQQLVAPLTQLQDKAVDTAANAPGYQPNLNNAEALASGGPNSYASNPHYSGTSVGAFSPSSVAQFQDPYTEKVVDQGLTDLDKQFQQQLNQDGAAAGNAGAFGGSRQAIQQGVDSRNFGDAAGKFTGDQLSAGYNNAVAARQGEINNDLALNQQGAAITAQNNAENQRGITNQVTLAGEGNQLASQQAQLESQAGGTVQANQQKTIDAANQQVQNEFAYPLNLAQQLSGINAGTAGAFPSTGVTNSTQAGGASKGSQLFGSGISALGSTAGTWGPALMALSDVRAKEDIRDDVNPEELLGAFAKLPVKSWQYTDDAQDRLGVDDQRHVGPMAQDVERLMGPDTAPDVDDAGTKGIDVISMLGHMASAIKALEARTHGLAPDDGGGSSRGRDDGRSITRTVTGRRADAEMARMQQDAA